MRIFFKQFTTMMCVMILSFMVLGNILVFTAFETTISRETEQNIEEMKIFQYAMLASLEGLPKDYQAVDLAAAEIVQSIQQSLYGDQGGIVLYDQDNTVIWQNSDYQSQLLGKDREGHTGVWQIASHNGHYYLESLCEINSTAGKYLLEIRRSIDHVYQDRDGTLEVLALIEHALPPETQETAQAEYQAVIRSITVKETQGSRSEGPVVK